MTTKGLWFLLSANAIHMLSPCQTHQTNLQYTLCTLAWALRFIPCPDFSVKRQIWDWRGELSSVSLTLVCLLWQQLPIFLPSQSHCQSDSRSIRVTSELEGQAGDFLVLLFRELVLQRRQELRVHLQDEALDIFDDGL